MAITSWSGLFSQTFEFSSRDSTVFKQGQGLPSSILIASFYSRFKVVFSEYCDTFLNLCIHTEGRQRHLRIQAACAKCGCKIVCLCNQPGKLALKTRRGGTDNLSECCGLTSRNRLTLGLLLWLLWRAPDVLGLIWGTQEAQQWTYRHPATWRDVAATPLRCSDRE